MISLNFEVGGFNVAVFVWFFCAYVPMKSATVALQLTVSTSSKVYFADKESISVTSDL